jgi:DNA-binding NarL/FixJ family response regulator
VIGATRPARGQLRVMLVDDVADLRLLLRSLFEEYPGVEVLAETGEGRAAIRLARELQPDLIVLDLAIHLLDGTALEQLRRAAPQARVVVLTAARRQVEPGALPAGATAFVEKSIATERLVPDILAGAGLLDAAMSSLAARAAGQFAPDARSPGRAREFASAFLGRREGTLLETVQLLLSELVTNAVLHAQTEACVTIAMFDRYVHVEVIDSNPVPALARSAAGADENGRGLALVAALAQRWGTVLVPDGKIMWFDVQRDQAER